MEIRLRKKGFLDTFTFGRYKGMRVQDVLEEDPDYILWVGKSIDYFPLETAVLMAAQMDTELREDYLDEYLDDYLDIFGH